MDMVKEITAEEILVSIIVIIFFCIMVIIITIIPYISKKIHNSYHKGYNEARNDKINYFQTMRDLDKEFTNVMKIANENNLELNVEFITELIGFGNKLIKLKNKY